MSKNDFTGVRAKLAKVRDEKAADTSVGRKTLPISGIQVDVPGYIHHELWMSAQRQAENDTAKAQAAFILEAVLFEGEKLTMADIKAGLLDGRDMLFLINLVFGDAEGAAGNAA